MSNTTRHQVDVTSITLNKLAMAMMHYRDMIWTWDRVNSEKLPKDYTQEQFDVNFYRLQSAWAAREAAMIKARAFHSDYMREESKLNQMGGMKPNGY